MDFTDDEVVAFHAAQQLQQLYDTYRAASRAHVLVLDRMDRQLEPDDALTTRRMELQRRRALAVENEAVFVIRRAQLQRRLLELDHLPELD